MLTLDNIDVSYGEVQALWNVSLEVAQGEIVALVGSNGAGKTTTLKTVSGLLHPWSGSITFEGKGGAFSSGLQVADLLGRPCAEKVLSPDSDPIRWAEFRAKLCPGRETKNSLIGLKIVPWDASFSDIWRDPVEKS